MLLISNTPIDVIAAFFISLVLSYLLTPAAGFFAGRLGFVDSPSSIKAHAHPTPLLGGAAIFVSFFLSIIFTAGFNKEIAAIIIGGTLLFMIGAIDDKIKMLPNIKLFGQLVAALAVVKMGIRVEFIKDYYLSTAFSLLWIIGITNAINILDNLNGLSAGISAISALFFGILAWERGGFLVATLSFGLCGGCLGFIRYNFPRASIFMGDAGSLFIGFLLATIAIMGNWASPTQITSLAIPIFVLGYPIFDTALVSISRTAAGRSIFQGGKDHSSHRLALLGLKKKRAVLLIFFINFCLGLSGYVISKQKNPLSAILIAVVVFLCMLALGIRLGMVEVTSTGRRKR